VDAPFGPLQFEECAGASEAEMADLEAYRVLLAEWNNRMNLVGPSALQSFWLRHAWDSAQLKTLAPEAKTWADVGAGAGFPGVVLAILLKQTPGATVHLIESMTKRCRFLTEVVERLGLNAEVHNVRAESARLKGVDVVTARACAPLPRLLEFSWPLLKGGAFGLFLKGQSLGVELDEAKKAWIFKASVSPSRSDPTGAIVKIEDLSRA
jgi:16S rRNA (guanine527-N7)-methyltransferase